MQIVTKKELRWLKKIPGKMDFKWKNYYRRQRRACLLIK